MKINVGNLAIESEVNEEIILIIKLRGLPKSLPYTHLRHGHLELRPQQSPGNTFHCRVSLKISGFRLRGSVNKKRGNLKKNQLIKPWEPSTTQIDGVGDMDGTTLRLHVFCERRMHRAALA